MPDAQDEVVEICRDLIRFASVNDGTGRGKGERAGRRVRRRQAQRGRPASRRSSSRRRDGPASSPGWRGRTRVATRCSSTATSTWCRPSPRQWTYDPFAAEVADGCVWGRGAVDMLDMDAMVLSVVRDRMRTGRKPPRDVVLAFVADEEAGGTFGASWLVDNHPELFEGCTEAISEVGGFSLSVNDDVRLYMIETAQKGMGWMRLTAEGAAGHGSMLSSDNAVTELCEAVARLGRHQFPMHLTKTVRRFLAEVSDAYGVELDPNDPEQIHAVLGPMARIVGATLRNTANPTMLDAGYKHNVIPGTRARDGRRSLPARLRGRLGARARRGARPEDHAASTRTTTSRWRPSSRARWSRRWSAALKAEDPGARPVPYALSGGTDAKSFSRLGIRGFGFSPLRLPADLDFSGMFHGVDERVPLDALRFGVRVLDRFLDDC